MVMKWFKLRITKYFFIVVLIYNLWKSSTPYISVLKSYATTLILYSNRIYFVLFHFLKVYHFDKGPLFSWRYLISQKWSPVMREKNMSHVLNCTTIHLNIVSTEKVRHIDRDIWNQKPKNSLFSTCITVFLFWILVVSKK